MRAIYRLRNSIITPGLYRRREKFWREHDRIDFFRIPIFIISYNRLTYLKGLVAQLKRMGYSNINIIDNHSTYKPLLEYYESTDCKVFHMTKNHGHMVFWECDEFRPYRNELYVVTDPDILPVDDCPVDFMEKLYHCLKKYPGIRKAGMSLKIDDIPKDAPLHDDVIRWESRFYRAKVPFTNCYVADVDTTLALYMPDCLNLSKNFLFAVRLGEPYQLRHLPWYKTKIEITQEDREYAGSRITGFWDEAEGKMRVDVTEYR